jgi:hypothetical protein
MIGVNAFDEKRVDIYGLITDIFPGSDTAYPFGVTSLCVMLVLVEVRGAGRGQVRCVFERTGEVVFQTSGFDIHGTHDPLAVMVMPVRIVECEFPRPGVYSIQFWYNEILIQDSPLHLRGLP